MGARSYEYISILCRRGEGGGRCPAAFLFVGQFLLRAGYAFDITWNVAWTSSMVRTGPHANHSLEKNCPQSVSYSDQPVFVRYIQNGNEPCPPQFPTWYLLVKCFSKEASADWSNIYLESVTPTFLVLSMGHPMGSPFPWNRTTNKWMGENMCNSQRERRGGGREERPRAERKAAKKAMHTWYVFYVTRAMCTRQAYIL